MYRPKYLHLTDSKGGDQNIHGGWTLTRREMAMGGLLVLLMKSLLRTTLLKGAFERRAKNLYNWTHQADIKDLTMISLCLWQVWKHHRVDRVRRTLPWPGASGRYPGSLVLSCEPCGPCYVWCQFPGEANRKWISLNGHKLPKTETLVRPMIVCVNSTCTEITAHSHKWTHGPWHVMQRKQ